MTPQDRPRAPHGLPSPDGRFLWDDRDGHWEPKDSWTPEVRPQESGPIIPQQETAIHPDSSAVGEQLPVDSEMPEPPLAAIRAPGRLRDSSPPESGLRAALEWALGYMEYMDVVPNPLTDPREGANDLLMMERALAALAATPAPPEPLDVDPTIWTWYGDWPGRRSGAGDGWLHHHPDGTRWVHPTKDCPDARAKEGKP